MVGLAFSAAAQTEKPATKHSSPAPPDKAFLQGIWDGWGTLNPDNVAGYHASVRKRFSTSPLK